MRIRAADTVSMNPAREFRNAMSDNPASTPSNPTSARKAESNRRNASKSTGPRTPQGKSWSRLNALKHGVLASQAVITTVEGRPERKAFEQLVDGLAHDFAPVGAFEQVLVQQIAACIWRQRRLLMFENRAAFQSRDNRTFREMNEPQRGMQPLYVIEKRKMEGVDILDEAGLGLDLPSERDTMRLVRYEASITRSLRNALAQLQARQQVRRAGGAEAAESAAAAPKDRAVVVDVKASKRNRGPEAGRLAAKVSLFAHGLEMEKQEEEEERLRAEEAAAAAESGENAAAPSENYQTKPNSPTDPDALQRHQQLLESADAVLKLSASLAPRRRPSED
jgi:hypothetical protein